MTDHDQAAPFPKIEVRSSLVPLGITVAALDDDGQDLMQLRLHPTVALRLAKEIIAAADEMWQAMRDMPPPDDLT